MILNRIVVITLGLLLAACSAAPKQSVVEQTMLVPQQFELQLKDNTPGTQQAVGEISLQYLELENADSRIVGDAINKQIRTLAGMDEAYNGNADVTTRVKVSQLTDNYALVVLETYTYRHGAANGQTIIQSAYFDLQTGKQAPLKQLLREGYKAALEQEIKHWLDENEIQHEFSSLKDNHCFYQRNGQSYFCFSQYEIAAGAQGVLNVPVRKEAIAPWINQKGLLAK